MNDMFIFKNLNIKLLILFQLFVFCSCSHKNSVTMPIQNHVIRLKPGEYLRKSIQQYAVNHHIKAGWMVTCAGSLTQYQLRFANQQSPSFSTGHFEIVSLTGTVSENGSHLHMSISDSTGNTIGGHLLEGCLVYTTAEIVIQSSEHLEFTREKDGTTPWEELQIKKLNN